MEYHEYANLFPMMNDTELNELVKDMRSNGYDVTSPVITYQDKILDGRNRQKAADLAGVTPTYDMYDGDDPLNFVIRHNLHRRHLSESQRMVIASRMANINFGDNQYKSGYANLRTLTSETLPKIG